MSERTLETVRPTRDARGFWRVLLGLVAPLPMLAEAGYYLLAPVDGDASFTDTVTAFAADPERVRLITALGAVFVVTLIPATVAVAWVSRRGAPRLATWGACLALPGFLIGFPLLGGPLTPAYLTVAHDLDVDAMARLDAAVHGEAVLGVAVLVFLAGIVIGLPLLGLALWRSKAVPAWAGIALALGAVTHPFLPGATAQGVGLLVAAVGFVAAGAALLRLPNQAFDLPPEGS